MTAWSATSITVTLRRESDSAALAGLFSLPLAPAYLWITDSAGTRNAIGFQFTLRPPGAAAVAAVNTPATLEVDTTYLVRSRVENTGAAGATAFKWQRRLNGGTWTDVTTSSAAVKAVVGAAFANNDDVPQVLGGGQTYVTNNDAASEDGTTTLPAAFAGSGAIEFVLAFQIVGADVADEDDIELRIVQDDGTVLDTYTQTPAFIVNKAGATVGMVFQPPMWRFQHLLMR